MFLQCSVTILSNGNRVLQAFCLETPLGSLLAIADGVALYRLQFVDRQNFEAEIEKLSCKIKLAITLGCPDPIVSIESELGAYFSGKLQAFKTPLHFFGSPFQQLVWNTLLRIPYGETRSYLEEAVAMGRPSACRAVAGANGANPLVIIVPCHRIINHNGTLGGYTAGIARKQWLIHHENQETT